MERWTEERMEELLPVVAKLAQKYTGGDSTSVTYERAQELMEAVLYCVREYEREQEFGLMAAEGEGMETVYQKGYELVVRKVKKMQTFYNRLSERFCSYGCRNYEDVVRKGLPEFFRRYDPRFAPQKTLLTLDYPTLQPLNGLTGIDAIEEYLSAVSLEQRFLGAFEEAYVRRVLSAYDWNYQEQFFNLCGVFLEHVLLRVLISVPFSEPVALEDRERLNRWREQRSEAMIQEELERILKELIKERYQGNELLYEYLEGAVRELAVRLKISGSANLHETI